VPYKSRINIQKTNNLPVFSLDNRAGCPQEPKLAAGMAVAALEAGSLCVAGIQGLTKGSPLYDFAKQGFRQKAITDSP